VRRIVRALEVHDKTGRAISQWQTQFSTPPSREVCRVFALDWPRETLNERINRRVEAMFAAGLVDEVRRLSAAGPLGRTAAQALGYREVLAHLAGERDLPSTIELVQRRTRQFAKRQGTWFRSLAECQFVPAGLAGGPHEWADEILARGGS
jgi:tRNA dimethylallyltransferase